MRAAFRATVLITLAAGVLAGCAKHNPTAPIASSNGVPGDFYRLWGSSYVDGAAFFSSGEDTAGQLVTMTVDGLPVAAALIRAGGRYVNVGTVRVGQSPPIASFVDTLARRSVPVYGTPWYLYTSVPNLAALPPVTFDGVAQHHFRVSGSVDFAAFDDSILSVRPPVVSAPAIGATVPRTSDLVVSWSDAGIDPDVQMICFVRSAVNSNIAPGLHARDLDGAATIQRFALEALPPGEARLTVIRYRAVRRVNGPVAVNLKCEAIVRRALTLQ